MKDTIYARCRWVEEQPDAIAILTDSETITYSELDCRINAIMEKSAIPRVNDS